MRIPWRRRKEAPEPLLGGVAEAHIAVGSLSGVPPTDIDAHVLLVLTNAGGLSVTGTTCTEATAMIVTMAAAALAQGAYARAHSEGGAHGHG